MPVEVKAMLEEQLRWRKIRKACMSKREHLPQDQERAATESIYSKVLTHSDDVIGKVCGPENSK
ncbi:hypothetical protein Ahy_B07g087481 [Arachis hypogaea]|uniref:Uncharacterized protein n=1 Tax=Arachis hypogaea TaxID=3818 RepID=A0A444YCA0_ARAHY|nr:hypothetical protein Ahy_B07g087481 [Arachis hypogaea]